MEEDPDSRMLKAVAEDDDEVAVVEDSRVELTGTKADGVVVALIVYDKFEDIINDLANV